MKNNDSLADKDVLSPNQSVPDELRAVHSKNAPCWILLCAVLDILEACSKPQTSEGSDVLRKNGLQKQEQTKGNRTDQ